MKIKFYLFLLFPIVTFSQLSEKVNSIYQELNSKKTVESQTIGYSGAESQVYLLYDELDKIATNSEIFYMAENGGKVVKNYMSAVLVDRKSKKILDLFRRFVANEEEVYIRTGCVGYKSTLAGELYNLIFYQNLKIDNIKFNKKNYTLKEIKEYQFDIDTKWTKKEVDSVLSQFNEIALTNDSTASQTISLIFRLNDYKVNNYERVKYYTNRYKTRETLATLANFQNKNDLELFHQNIAISFLAMSKFPDESFIKILQSEENENLENLDYYEAISSFCDNDSNQIKKNIFSKLSKSDNLFTQEYLQYFEEALKKYDCETNKNLLLEIEKFHIR